MMQYQLPYNITHNAWEPQTPDSQIVQMIHFV